MTRVRLSSLKTQEDDYLFDVIFTTGYSLTSVSATLVLGGSLFTSCLLVKVEVCWVTTTSLEKVLSSLAIKSGEMMLLKSREYTKQS
jgi:hypothetical protein